MKNKKLTDHVWRLWRCVNDLTTETRNNHATTTRRIDAVRDELNRVKDVASSEIMHLEGRIDAQARTIADLEKQIAGLRGSRDAHMVELKSLRTWISDLSKQVAPLIPSPDMV